MKEIGIYWKGILSHAGVSWINSPVIVDLIKTILGLLTAMWTGIGGLFVGVLILTVFDVIIGTRVSIKKGNSFSSRKFRKGLVEKTILYALLFIVSYVLEGIIKTSIPYEQFYLVGFSAAIFGFYEASSIIEGLIYLYPEYPFLKRLGNYLHILDKKVEEKVTGMDGEGEE